MLQGINTCTHVYDHAASLNLIYTYTCTSTIQMCHPKTGPLRKTRHPGGRSKANSIIGYIKGIAPPNCLPDAPLASQLNTVMEQLLCSVCLDVLLTNSKISEKRTYCFPILKDNRLSPDRRNHLCQPLELPCRALVCTMCTVQLFRAFNCNDVKCPCCYSETPVIPSELKPAPPLVQALLSNVMVHCITCTRDMRACEYNTHECSVSPTRTEV